MRYKVAVALLGSLVPIQPTNGYQDGKKDGGVKPEGCFCGFGIFLNQTFSMGFIITIFASDLNFLLAYRKNGYIAEMKIGLVNPDFPFKRPASITHMIVIDKIANLRIPYTENEKHAKFYAI